MGGYRCGESNADLYFGGYRIAGGIRAPGPWRMGGNVTMA